ncbi:MAG: succinate dehydrogenase [Nitrospinota bacterium]|nr:MAG: succinate dehydrogenase [Nitrospinota bacterium]
MPSFAAVLWSSVGKKILAGLTGLIWCLFVLVHLLGNLTLLTGHADAFNKYSHFLISLGKFLIIIELALVAALLLHIIIGATITLGKRKARPVRYLQVSNAGGPSRKSFASTTMIYTGILVFIFLIIHLIDFKFGPGIEEGYVAQLGGVEMRDLYRLVVETFSNKWYVLLYVVAMLPLGFHLSHGAWSAFQSLGLGHEKYTPILYVAGYVFAVVIAAGYIIIPIWIYLTGGPQ